MSEIVSIKVTVLARSLPSLLKWAKQWAANAVRGESVTAPDCNTSPYPLISQSMV